MVSKTRDDIGSEVVEGFVNEEIYGFIPLDRNKAGCIYGIREMHEEYISGKLGLEKIASVWSHLAGCESCGESWNDYHKSL